MSAAPSVVCPTLVGRAAELGALREMFDAAAGGRGGLVALVGEAGAGKSRLARALADAARDGGATVLTGRTVPGPHPAPYRPLAEALVAAPRPDAAALGGFAGHLARIVPGWPADGTVDGSPVLLSEGVARLLGVLGDARGCVLVLEDLHWADPETLDAVEHLGDALAGRPALCLVTTRPEGAAADLVDRLERRGAARAITVAALPDGDVDAMLAACLGTTTPPPELSGFLHAHSDGNPFLVEELLAGLVASGGLAYAGGRWTCPGELTPTVPATLRSSIGRRLAGLDPGVRRVLGAAALLGRRFDWELLPGIAEADGRAVVEALRVGVDEQLVQVAGSGFGFRHALTREAVLDDLLPPDRHRLAVRAWPAVERAHPGLPGPVCELAAELAEAAGDPAAAAVRLVESARRALAGGALGTAETAARRARRMATGPVEVDAAEILVRVLVGAGKPGDALAVLPAPAARAAADATTTERGDRRPADPSHVDGTPADASAPAGPDLPAARRADLLVLLARAALDAGDADLAERHVSAARAAAAAASRPGADRVGDRDERPAATAGGRATSAGTTDPTRRGDRIRPDRSSPDPAAGPPGALDARIAAVAARVALARSDLGTAADLARAAVTGAQQSDEPAVECEALEVLGRVARIESPASGDPWFRRAADVARSHGLVDRHLRAQHELALSALGATGDVVPLRATRDLAAGYGAMVTVAVMDLTLADIALLSFDRAGCLAAASACAEASRRYRLATEPVAQLWLAGAHALAGDDDAMHAAIAAALARDPGDPRVLGDLHGRVLATRCLVEDDLDGLATQLDAMMEHVSSAAPGTSVFPGRLWWAIVHAAADADLGEHALAVYADAAEEIALPAFRSAGGLVEAVAMGRRGDAAGAAMAVVKARVEVRSTPLGHGAVPAMLLVADAAIRDGWGEPATWLRECEAFFGAGGYERAARRCRRLLARAGAPVPRRGRGEATVPPSLRALGVTSREVDVLALVAAGLSTREIAERLVLSPRTVERHLGSLFDRTGVRGRQALGELARRHGVQTG